MQPSTDLSLTLLFIFYVNVSVFYTNITDELHLSGLIDWIKLVISLNDVPIPSKNVYLECLLHNRQDLNKKVKWRITFSQQPENNSQSIDQDTKTEWRNNWGPQRTHLSLAYWGTLMEESGISLRTVNFRNTQTG